MLAPSLLDALVELKDIGKDNYLRSLSRLGIPDTVKAEYEALFQHLSNIGVIRDGGVNFRFIDSRTSNAGLSAPLRVFLSLNEDCNYVCKHCSVSATRKGVQMSFDRAKSLVNELSALGVPEIAVVGGEPFLYPYLLDFVEFAADQFISISITTNGSLIRAGNEQRLRPLRNTIRYVHVSIEGDEQVTDYIRGAGAFAAAMYALNILDGVGIESAAHLTITRRMAGRENELITSLSKHGVKRMCAGPIRAAGRALSHPELYLDATDEQRIYKRLRAAADEAGILTFGLEEAPLTPTLRQILGVKGCGAGATAMSVGADGSVYSCNFLRDFGKSVGRQPMNINDHSAEYIWHLLSSGDRSLENRSGRAGCPAVLRPSDEHIRTSMSSLAKARPEA